MDCTFDVLYTNICIHTYIYCFIGHGDPNKGLPNHQTALHSVIFYREKLQRIGKFVKLIMDSDLYILSKTFYSKISRNE